VIVNDAPSVLKAQLGSTVAELGFQDEGEAERARVLLSDQHRTVEREATTVRLSTNDGPRVLIEVLRILDGVQLAPATLAVHEPSLDDVFLALTGHHAEAETTPEEPVGAGRRGGP
jgi:ABC-2 type transport system ATP-binding protein